jgi:hypothetical protein
MNDPYEGHNSLFFNSKQNVFGSSWTLEKEDEIPMWKLYTDLKGARIRMPIDMFNTEENLYVIKVEGNNNYLIKSKLSDKYIIERTPIDNVIGRYYKKEFIVDSVYGPTMVEYYESKELLEKGIIDINKKADFKLYEININLLGQRKIDYWKFEKEFRYRIFFANGLKIAGSEDVLNSFVQNSPVKTEHVDIKFKTSSLNNVEIVLGPKTNKSDLTKVEKILNKINAENYSVSKSKISII